MYENSRLVQVDYCMWGSPMRKKSLIWTNLSPEYFQGATCNGKCSPVSKGAVRHLSGSPKSLRRRTPSSVLHRTRLPRGHLQHHQS